MCNSRIGHPRQSPDCPLMYALCTMLSAIQGLFHNVWILGLHWTIHGLYQSVLCIYIHMYVRNLYHSFGMAVLPYRGLQNIPDKEIKLCNNSTHVGRDLRLSFLLDYSSCTSTLRRLHVSIHNQY